MTATSHPLLRVENLHIDIHTATHTKHVVRAVDFTLERGKTLCIVGESGCGKSLTALALLDLLPAAARRRMTRLEFAGQDLSTLNARQLAELRGARIAMIFQDPMTSLNPVFQIGTQLIDVMRRHKRVSRREAAERAEYLLRRVGITNPEERMRQYPFELSGGLRQRVMIAMALMCGPELLIADEPTTALDVTVQAELLDLLRDIQAEFGLGMVFISHDMGLVARIADHVIVMYAGDIVEGGTVQEVLTRPSHPYTAMLLNCIPQPGRTAPRTDLPTIAGAVPSLDVAIRGCAFRERCPVAEARCAQPLVSRMQGSHRCLCVKPGALMATKTAGVSA
ncbi:ABC transporter ATP-binding protein [Achromobacter spanius]|uniref:Peptide ABC transporter substrate-binding protein n=1 Tax=Achromobacter spanius TaxID=217203 RepID=A0AAW3IHC5_9BURK|nr:ABC transporter ATP-binding protein [Achromobacter spanius]AZS79549.1 ABC transporter ATP-binding protein [Achromobacter spanius]KNE29648.1 peptide ABC transporter substrate-binding protein [Achromobacter spanius]